MTNTYKGDLVAPFNIYSSSVNTGYAADLSSSFKPGIDITDLHHDSYGNDNTAGMQGPFTETHVGGLQRRHQPLNSGTLDTEATRAEGFRIIYGTGVLFVRSAEYNSQNSVNNNLPRAEYYREELAKRPVNVRHIKSSTGSLTLGNYSKDYEIIQMSGRSTNNKKFVELEGFSLTASYSPFVTGAVGQTKTSRGKTGYVFVERFSAPGSLETMGDADGTLWMDPHAAEYSPYNALPWRNLHVREPVNYRLNLAPTIVQLHTHSNAASDPNGNESISISFGTDGWDFTGSGAGVATYSTDSSVGTYAIETSNTSGSSGLEYVISTVAGQTYTISLNAKSSGTVDNQGLFDWEGFTTSPSVKITNTGAYQTYSYALVANGTTAKIKVWAAGTSSVTGSGKTVLFDNVSITTTGNTVSKNYIVRAQQPLRSLLSSHSDRHGLSGSAVAADYSGVANYHKTQRNTGYVATLPENFTFGDEIHTESNAAADPNGTEANATTGWTATNGNPTSWTSFPYSGSYIIYRAPAVDGAGSLEYTFSAEIGAKYYIQMAVAADVQGTAGSTGKEFKIGNWIGVKENVSIIIPPDLAWAGAYQYHRIIATAISSSVTIKFVANDAAQDEDYLILDAVSIRKINNYSTKKYDNWYVTHAIPRRDTGYRWITASAIDVPLAPTGKDNDISFLQDSEITAFVS